MATQTVEGLDLKKIKKAQIFDIYQRINHYSENVQGKYLPVFYEMAQIFICMIYLDEFDEQI